MGMAFSLTLEQTQKLVMTQELRQAISILQLPTQELLDYVEEELEENPLLELSEDDTRPDPPVAEPEAEAETEWADRLEGGSDLPWPSGPASREEAPAWENFISRETTLAEHLAGEWRVTARTREELRIGLFIIGNLDEHGYLRSGVTEMAQALNVPRFRILRVLRGIQRLDPPGVGARSLEECLLIQARALGRLSPPVRRVIKGYLRDLAEGKLTRVASDLGLSLEEVQAIRDFIRTLDPKPGRRYASGEEIQYVVPDVSVEKVEGEYVILVNDAAASRLTLNNYYRRLLAHPGECDPNTRRYLEHKLNSALWLIRSIEQRRRTVYRIVEVLLRRQRAFFDYGVRYLQPLTLRQVAEEIGMHESTVSRATANKFIQTPQGVFPLRFLFGSGVESAGGTAAAAESVKRLLADFVAKEDPRHPLSDQKLAELLGQRGISVSRRTVAKYREEARIPCSASRRRFA
ncbi:RNA polymerase factor sigma-54 [Gelria sp. Kuro-4]|uniref:RNA polymerase factor sigma-54 n=1 Tax=Gelria sp. Kuro-4 TaxID=2796927 RepID=UPI001BF13364|nr:RNA polymerase factor sigma-54 [Gelria sp. Kuro-4]BCV25756.1 RNA polymerase sigma-54 factor [Gelria sp. Kuro-4]